MGNTQVSVIGSYVTDLAFKGCSLPKVGETRIAPNFFLGPGGKGFNQAVACHRQGIETLFIGAVGDDLFRGELERFAATEGLKTALEVKCDSYTGAASIAVDLEGRNQITVALGANGMLSPSWIEQFRADFAGVKVALCQLESNLAATRTTFEIARQQGAITILNPAPINELLNPALLDLADIIVPNESEFRFLVNQTLGLTLDETYWKQGNNDLHALCRELNIPTIVITLGENGCFVSHNREALKARGENHYIILDQNDFYSVGVIPVDVVDTTGAGDAFNGGLAAGLIHHPESFSAAIHRATVVAGLSTTRSGTAPSMPRRDEVEKLLAECYVETSSN